MDLNGETLRWILGRGAGLLIGMLVLLLVYRVGVSAIHRLVPTVINAQAAHLPSGSSSDEEVGKRIRTIEDLLLKLLRMGVLAGFVVIALAVFELWGLLTAIAVVLVAIVFATRDVVLDYVMGFLILIEGPFFKGDYVSVSGHPGIEGVVEEIGLRRTLLRDSMGSSHAVSNGFIRLSSNMTRLFSVAVVDFHVLHAGELDQALATAARVANEMRGDATWADRFADAPTDIWVTGIGMDGASIRLQQRVPTGAQAAVASELRRRLAAALTAVSIGTGRWDTPMPIVSQSSGSPREG
jgi:small-conductance mechanosensitive channel